MKALLNGPRPFRRQYFGGNHFSNHRPQMGSVRPNVFKNLNASQIVGVVSKLNNLTSSPEDIRMKRLDFIPFSKDGYNIQEADIIVAGGRGMGFKENFDKAL